MRQDILQEKYARLYNENDRAEMEHFFDMAVFGTYTKVNDFTYDVDGSVSMGKDITKGPNQVPKHVLSRVKFRNVTGRFMCHTSAFDINNYPVSCLELDVAMPLDRDDFSMLPTKSTSRFKVTLNTSKTTPFKGTSHLKCTVIDIILDYTQIGSFEGLPAKCDTLLVEGYGATIEDLLGMPQCKNARFLDVQIRDYKNLSHVTQHLKLYNEPVHEVLQSGSVGDKVGGYIIVTKSDAIRNGLRWVDTFTSSKDIFPRVTLNKKYYSQQYINAVKQGSDAANANLDF